MYLRIILEVTLQQPQPFPLKKLIREYLHLKNQQNNFSQQKDGLLRSHGRHERSKKGLWSKSENFVLF